MMRFVWLRRLVVASVIAVGLGWLPYQLYGSTGLHRLVGLRAEVARLRADNAAVRDENARLRAELATYDDDDAGAVERVARDELGLVRPGDIVYRVESKAPEAR